MRGFYLTHKKKVIIILSIVALNMVFGFDARFTVINLVWLMV